MGIGGQFYTNKAQCVSPGILMTHKQNIFEIYYILMSLVTYTESESEKIGDSDSDPIKPKHCASEENSISDCDIRLLCTTLLCSILLHAVTCYHVVTEHVQLQLY